MWSFKAQINLNMHAIFVKGFRFKELNGQWISIGLIACYLYVVNDGDYLTEQAQHD